MIFWKKSQAILVNMKGKKTNKLILVTGIAGFIGFFTAKRLLELGYTIIGIDNLNDYYDVKLKNARLKILESTNSKNSIKNNFEFIKLDIADYKKLETVFKKHSFDIVIHLAAQAGVRYSMENPHVYAHSNYLGTLNIFELVKKYTQHKSQTKFAKIIYASSSSVYGNSIPPYDEKKSDTNTPISIYAATKKATELLAHTYTHLYKMDVVCLRFFTVYGPWSRPDMAMIKFAKNILLGKEIILYNKGKMKRGFTYIDDIVEGILNSQNLKGYNIINLGGNELITLNHLVKTLEKYLGKKANIKLGEIQPGDVRETNAVQVNAKKLIKFNPEISFDEGVKNFANWYLENKKLCLSLKDGKQ